MNKIRFGILGTARICNRLIPAINSTDCAVVFSIASRNGDKAAGAAAQWNINKSYSAYDALIEDPDVDAVYVPLPNSMHYEWCLKALKANKHVLVEKPIVLKTTEIKNLKLHAQKHNRRIMEAFWYRFHPLIADVQKIINDGSLGKIIGVTGNFSFVNQDNNDIRWHPEVGGGVLFDLFCYHVDALQYLFHVTPQTIASCAAFAHGRSGVDGSVCAEIVTREGMVCTVIASMETASPNNTLIVGTNGSIEVPELRVFPENQTPVFTVHANGSSSRRELAQSNAYATMVEAFCESIHSQTQCPVSIEESENNIGMLELIRSKILIDEQRSFFIKPRHPLVLPLLSILRRMESLLMRRT